MNALMLSSSQRAATLRLTSSGEHHSNYYDVIHDPDELQQSYNVPRMSPAAECCESEYLTPTEMASNMWTTETMETYDETTDNGGYQRLTDSGKYLQLQDSVYYN